MEADRETVLLGLTGRKGREGGAGSCRHSRVEITPVEPADPSIKIVLGSSDSSVFGVSHAHGLWGN